MRLAALVAASERVAATGSRTEKETILAEALAELRPQELPAGVALLAGATRQRATGVGWAALRDLPEPAPEPGSLEVAAVDAALERLAAVRGSGSRAERAAQLEALFGAATAAEQAFLRAVLSEGVRQGASRAAVAGALSRAAGVGREPLRRALALNPDLGDVARIAFAAGDPGLAAVRLEVGRPLEPMLAGSAPDLAAALARAGGAATAEAKLDGVRVQVHRLPDGSARVYTRTLDDVTDRVPEVVAAVRDLPGGTLVLDGEAIALDHSGRPEPFQITNGRFGSRVAKDAVARIPLTTVFFDLLHADGEDLLDLAAHERLARLDALVGPDARIERSTDTERIQAQAIAAGHEGIMVKDPEAPYTAGRRATSWLKVKPRHTFDLVVLAAEWGHGRRTGSLSNLHLGARDPAAPSGFVMLGKTFKGLTDEMLAWQTDRLLALEARRTAGTVWVRPELVVEIAFDGLQASRRYPGGVALRFARVLRHRPDKRAEEADTLAAVLSAASATATSRPRT